MWHRDFPTDAREMFDVLAKALMIRAGGTVSLTSDEMRSAAETAAEIEWDSDKLTFRVERN